MKTPAAALVVIATLAFGSPSAFAQGAALPNPPPPDTPLPAPPPPMANYPPQELDRIVSPIALYPDPLLAQVLAAATFSPEIPDAAQWSDQHHYLRPEMLPAAIAADRLPWQPPVQALLPFPSVLDMMASSMPWTEEIGSAFLADPQQVMDAVQRMRQTAYGYGYLQSSPQVVVRSGPFIEILPANPAYIVVPYYRPDVVFVAPRRGFVVTSAVSFGFGVTIGTAFEPWGWGGTRFVWTNHALIVNNAPWGRTWVNHVTYVHPYAVQRYTVVRTEVRPADHHELVVRSPNERESQRTGHVVEEHKKPEERKKGG